MKNALGVNDFCKLLRRLRKGERIRLSCYDKRYSHKCFDSTRERMKNDIRSRIEVIGEILDWKLPEFVREYYK